MTKLLFTKKFEEFKEAVFELLRIEVFNKMSWSIN